MNQPTTLGIDFGGTSIKFGVVQDGRIISHGNVVSTRQDGEIEPLIRSIVDEILRLQREYPRFRRSALGCRAFIDPVAGVVVNLTNVKGWCHIPLGALVSERIGWLLTWKMTPKRWLRRMEARGRAQFAQRDLRDVRHSSRGRDRPIMLGPKLLHP